jgi:toxin ParE1/3/4
MDFKVIFHETFLSDLRQIVVKIAAENPAAARRLGHKIITKAESLSFFPKRYPVVRQKKSVRRFVVDKTYKVFYRINVEMNSVDVLRCWDGRRWSEPQLR